MLSLILIAAAATPLDPIVAFPMQPAAGPAGEPARWSLTTGALEEIAPFRSIEILAAPLANGGSADLVLERVDFTGPELLLMVDGSLQGGSLPGVESLWSGKVRGEEHSSVFLAFSPLGSRGWIYTGGEYHHLLAEPGAGADWTHSTSRIVSETQLSQLGSSAPLGCAQNALYPPNHQPTIHQPQLQPGGGSTLALGGPGVTLSCRLAVETDYQLFQVFNNLAATQAYTGQLLAASSTRYVEQINTVLNIVYLSFYTSNTDPWTSNDTGAGSVNMLYEFQAAWQNNMPNGANLSHFVSGAGLGGGVAWLDVLCNPQYGFAVSGNLAGQTPFPVVQGPLNWDFMVFTHELGHNFSSPHTHDFCPAPLDQCAPNGYFGSCQSQSVCINNGTIMSYCHLCNGGLNNISPYFHPQCVTTMRTAAENSCIGPWCTGPAGYCAANPNQTGQTAQIAGSGSTSIAANSFTLSATQMPANKTGFFLYGKAPTQVTLGNGFRCIDGQFFRLPVQNTGSTGSFSRTLNFTQAPFNSGAGQIFPGTQLYFQAYYRDTGFGAGVNLTGGVRVPFCP